MIWMKLEGENILIADFQKIGHKMEDKKKLFKDVLRPAARIVVKTMRGMTPVLKSAPAFNVYRTPKLSGKMKAPKGMGNIYVAIKPNQLKKSVFYFQTPASRRSGGVNIGPRYKRGVWMKPEKGGWFMHMVQFGTDFVEPQSFVLPALVASRAGVATSMKKDMKGMLKEVTKKVAGNKIEVI